GGVACADRRPRLGSLRFSGFAAPSPLPSLRPLQGSRPESVPAPSRGGRIREDGELRTPGMRASPALRDGGRGKLAPGRTEPGGTWHRHAPPTRLLVTDSAGGQGSCVWQEGAGRCPRLGPSRGLAWVQSLGPAFGAWCPAPDWKEEEDQDQQMS
ncbi:hypothetical protein H1C71_041682, partial [Ictidomys tridecemlineatus]